MGDLPPRALVTAGTKRLGLAFARRLAAEGFDLAIHCRRVDEAARTAEAELRDLGRRVVLLQADLADEAATLALVPAAVAALGPLGLLVNNAAIFELDRIATMTPASWRRHLAINLTAPTLLCQGFVRQLPTAAAGLIVNILDERVVNLTPNYLSYSVAKSGLWALTQILARDLAPGIRVNAIGPGPALPVPGSDGRKFQELCRRMPLERGTSPDELAEALAFILRSPSMTGHLMLLDGGQHLGWLTPGWAITE